MTSLLAWVGVDSRHLSSIYLASDSRISWGDVANWDFGRKLFASTKYPEIIGYVGDVLFPSLEPDRKILCRFEALEHQVNGSEIDKRFTRGRVPVILFTELSVAPKPGKGSLNNPAFRNDCKSLLVFRLLHDLDGEIGAAFGPIKQPAFVALIGTNRL